MILPVTGRGTMRSVVEGQAPRSTLKPLYGKPHQPLHLLRWFPSPEGEE